MATEAGHPGMLLPEFFLPTVSPHPHPTPSPPAPSPIPCPVAAFHGPRGPNPLPPSRVEYVWLSGGPASFSPFCAPPPPSVRGRWTPSLPRRMSPLKLARAAALERPTAHRTPFRPFLPPTEGRPSAASILFNPVPPTASHLI
eukprot:TRINITY_DN4317_c0_g1_i1.p2 TRINITY_DN4317_c0_g1~~TRINITY_DN4317_c0_g1_i1.p2  ORF type:complete len:143 (+),score=0.60 TRINITY_DN4317_c0_g1_i1:1110-1538(+)